MNEAERVKALLVKYNIVPKKSFGQNFLIDEHVIRSIISLFDYSIYDEVIEIGPGIGALTIPLFDRAKKLTVIEADRDMVKILKDIFQDKEITIVQNDFLKYEFEDEIDKNRLIIGNLPYNITSALLKKLIKSNFSTFGIMVQKEVAEKLIYVPGKKENTPMGLFLACGYKIDGTVQVKSSSFFPSPKVDSTFIRIDKYEDIDYKYYLLFKIMFKDNNKAIKNCLKQNKFTKDYLSKIHREEINALLLLRARQLTVSQAKYLAKDILSNK